MLELVVGADDRRADRLHGLGLLMRQFVSFNCNPFQQIRKTWHNWTAHFSIPRGRRSIRHWQKSKSNTKNLFKR